MKIGTKKQGTAFFFKASILRSWDLSWVIGLYIIPTGFVLHDTSGNSYYFGVSCPGFHHSNRWLQHFQHDQENFTFFSWFMNYFEKKDPTDTRWVPANYKWGRNPYKYDSTVITPITNIFAAIYRGPIAPHLKLDPGPTFSPQIRSSSNERTALTTTNRQLVTFFRSLVWFEKWLLMDIILNHLIWYDMIWFIFEYSTNHSNITIF